jgi:hypothetical protein
LLLSGIILTNPKSFKSSDLRIGIVKFGLERRFDLVKEEGGWGIYF